MLGLESDPLPATVPFQPSGDSIKNQLRPPFRGTLPAGHHLLFEDMMHFLRGDAAACLSEVPRCLHGGRPEGGEKSGLLVFLPDRIGSGGGGGGGVECEVGGGGVKAARFSLCRRASARAQRSVSVNDVCSRREEALVSWQAALTD